MTEGEKVRSLPQARFARQPPRQRGPKNPFLKFSEVTLATVEIACWLCYHKVNGVEVEMLLRIKEILLKKIPSPYKTSSLYWMDIIPFVVFFLFDILMFT